MTLQLATLLGLNMVLFGLTIRSWKYALPLFSERSRIAVTTWSFVGYIYDLSNPIAKLIRGCHQPNRVNKLKRFHTTGLEFQKTGPTRLARFALLAPLQHLLDFQFMRASYSPCIGAKQRFYIGLYEPRRRRGGGQHCVF